jgi:hypothetical protein
VQVQEATVASYYLALGWTLSCNIVTAIVNGVEMVIDPNDPSNWHTPKNEREYLRSPQKAAWRTARAPISKS